MSNTCLKHIPWGTEVWKQHSIPADISLGTTLLVDDENYVPTLGCPGLGLGLGTTLSEWIKSRAHVGLPRAGHGLGHNSVRVDKISCPRWAGQGWAWAWAQTQSGWMNLGTIGLPRVRLGLGTNSVMVDEVLRPLGSPGLG